jgi:hypothetical protein
MQSCAVSAVVTGSPAFAGDDTPCNFSWQQICSATEMAVRATPRRTKATLARAHEWPYLENRAPAIKAPYGSEINRRRQGRIAADEAAEGTAP